MRCSRFVLLPIVASLPPCTITIIFVPHEDSAAKRTLPKS